MIISADLTEMRRTIADVDLAKRISVVLMRDYPGWPWAVNVDSQAGVATIHNALLSGQWGYRIRLVELTNDPEMRTITRAGGEILERHAISRGRLQPAELGELKRDVRGLPVGDRTRADVRRGAMRIYPK